MSETTNEKPKNPLLERIQLPGATYRLPSGGTFYTDGEIDFEAAPEGEVHVYPMSAIDEIVIRSPDKILNGQAVKEVFGRCIPDVKKPERLFTKDMDFLMMALRHVTYGPTIDVGFNHHCDNSKERIYTIDINELIDGAKAIDPTTVGALFTVTLPNGQIVKLHPLRFNDAIALMQVPDDVNIELQAFQTIATVIDSVDEVTDKVFILEWATKLHALWFKMITQAFENNSDWGPSTAKQLQCKDCEQKISIDLPLNPIIFFT